MSNPEIESLKRSVGRRPFDQRLTFKADYAKCPFHEGDSDKSLHLKKYPDGFWIATCFSGCQQKKWDVIEFVMEYAKVQGKTIDFTEACEILRGGKTPERTETVEETKPVEEKQPRMTAADWPSWGRPITAADVARFARNRKDKTAGLDYFVELGCRVRGDYIGFPNFYTTPAGEIKYDLVRIRHMDKNKREPGAIQIEHKFTMKGLYNRNTVNPVEDVYVVEGEPDVAIMEENGFRAVSVVTGSQKEFDRRSIMRLAKAARVFIVGDMQSEDDEEDADPGAGCMDLLEKQMRAVVPEKLFRFAFEGAHDVSELATHPGFVHKINQLSADATAPWVQKHVPLISQLNPDPPKWLIEELFPYGCLSLIAGMQGAQKSYFALAAAKALTGAKTKGENPLPAGLHIPELDRAAWEPSKFLGLEILQETPVLYIDKENPESVVADRLRKMGVLARRNFHIWGRWMTGAKAVPVEPNDPKIMQFAAAGGFVFFDSLQQWYNGASEIDNTAMSVLMNKFQDVARAGAGALVLHHQDKYGQSQYRGATAIVATPDMSIGFKIDKEDPQRIVKVQEIRFRMCGGWEMDFRFDFRPDFHELILVRPKESLSQKVRKEKLEQRAAEEAEGALADKVAAEIAKSLSTPPTTLERPLAMGRGRVEKLAAKRGWKWNEKKKLWVGKPPAQAALEADSDTEPF